MADLFDEIKEDIVKEKYLRLWNKFGKHLVALAVLVVIATAATVAYNSYSVSKSAKIGEKLFFALNDSGAEKEKKLQEIIDLGVRPYSGLASLYLANQLYADGKYDLALKNYKSLSEDKKQPKELVVLAKIAYLKSKSEKDALNKDDVESLSEIISNKEPFYLMAMELRASNFLKAGDLVNAQQDYNLINLEPSASDQVKMRAEQVLGVIKSELSK